MIFGCVRRLDIINHMIYILSMIWPCTMLRTQRVSQFEWVKVDQVKVDFNSETDWQNKKDAKKSTNLFLFNRNLELNFFWQMDFHSLKEVLVTKSK